MYKMRIRGIEMVDNICKYLMKKIEKQMPDINKERKEIIMYGLELIIGEVSKLILLIVIAIILKIGWLVTFAYISMLPYKVTAGGFHLKTHIGCLLGTFIIYFGNVFLSKYIIIEIVYIKYIVIGITWIFSIIMIGLYAPADTVNVPILRKKERKTKKNLSYIFMSLTLIVSLIINNSVVSNILLFNVIIESFSISKLAYILTKNEYGFKVYNSKKETIS